MNIEHIVVVGTKKGRRKAWEEKVESRKRGYWRSEWRTHSGGEEGRKRVIEEGRKQKEWILKKQNPVVSEEHIALERREEKKWEQKVKSKKSEYWRSGTWWWFEEHTVLERREESEWEEKVESKKSEHWRSRTRWWVKNTQRKREGKKES
jgi:hypothetical protein